jgi:beta-glucosidase
MPVDRDVQEEATELTWSGDASFVLSGKATDFVRESNGEMAIELVYSVVSSGAGTVSIGLNDSNGHAGTLDVTDAIKVAEGAGWKTSLLRLSCFAEQGVDMSSVTEPLVISAGTGLKIQIVSAQLVANPGDAGCRL